jgi:hypothetical protein
MGLPLACAQLYMIIQPQSLVRLMLSFSWMPRFAFVIE